MHLKSHGGANLLLSGLTPELLAKKQVSQGSVVEKYLDAMEKLQFEDEMKGKRVMCESHGGFFQDNECLCFNGARDNKRNTCKRNIGYAGLVSSLPGELAYESIGLGKSQDSKNYPKVFESMGWVGEGMGYTDEGLGWRRHVRLWRRLGLAWRRTGVFWPRTRIPWRRTWL